MNNPDVDEVVNYLSSKFNRIFCEREFVSCVLQDFQVILCDKNKCCVLLFPALEPLYQKALRYQARIFDLAVFTIACGKFRSVAVCHKDHLLKKTQEPEASESTMLDNHSKPEATSTSAASRRKRPERQLYVPPAQRRSRLLNQESTEENLPKVTSSKRKSNGTTSKARPQPSQCDLKNQECNNNQQQKFKSSQNCISDVKTCVDHEENEDKHSFARLCHSDILNVLDEEFIIKYKYKVIDISYSEFNVQLYDLGQQHLIDGIQPWKTVNYLKAFSKCSESELNLCVPIFRCPGIPFVLYVLKTCRVYWQPDILFVFPSDVKKSDSAARTFPLFDFTLDNSLPEDHNHPKVPLLTINGLQDTLYAIVMKSFDCKDVDDTALRIECDSDAVISLQSFMDQVVTSTDGPTDDAAEAEPDEEDPSVKPEAVDSTNLSDKVEKCTIKEDKISSDHVIVLPEKKIENNSPSSPEQGDNQSISSDHVIVLPENKIENNSPLSPDQGDNQSISSDHVIVLPENKIENNSPSSPEQGDNQSNKKEVLKNKLNSSREKKVSGNSTKIPPKKNEHEEEKEIMRKAKENINRRTRPIMKYVDDSNDFLRIDKNEDNINNWEDLFDDDGQLQCDLLNDITQKVGEEVTLVTAVEDYSAYANKSLENLEHVVELYGFPPSFETHDIMQSFSFIKSDAMYIKWVDDTHALLVLGSLTQAQRAVEHNNPLIKARPMTAASSVALEAANKSDLKPAMKRPQTNLQTARRLITTHLGARSRVSKEQTAKEKEDLKTARELRKIAKQNERDAWEGNLRSAMK